MNDRLPLRFIKDEPRKRTKYIIIHTQRCQLNIPDNELTIDSKKYQTGKLKNLQIMESGLSLIPYHYTVELFDNDYIIQTTCPEHYMIDYDDINDEYKYQIHIQIIGDFNYMALKDRLQESLQFYLIDPILFRYGLQPERVLLHDEIKNDESLNILGCPGSFFKKDRLMQYVNKYYRTGSL